MTRRQYRAAMSERRRENTICAALMMMPGLVVFGFVLFAIAQLP